MLADEKTVMIAAVGEDARFTYQNAGGQDLQIDGGVNAGPVASSPDLTGLKPLEQLSVRAEHAARRIEGVTFTGKIASGTDRESDLVIHQSADHLEVKPATAEMGVLTATEIDPMVLTR